MPATKFAPKTWNADERLNLDGSITSRFTGGWQNFLNNNAWQKINPAFKEDANSFFIDEAPYNFIAPKRLSGEFFFENRNAYDTKNQRIVQDAYVGKSKKFLANDVEGIATPSGILYSGAFGFGDLLIESREQRVSYITKINTKPSGSGNLEVPFLQQLSGTTAVRDKNNKKASLVAVEKNIGEGLIFGSKDTRQVISREAYAWDSAGKTIRIPVIATMVGGTLQCKKVIPRSFLESAVYPVFTDTTDTFTADTADRGLTSDGGGSWSAARSGTSIGLEALNRSAHIIVAWNYGGGYAIYRAWLWWATGATIPASNAVSAVVCNIYFAGTHAPISRTSYIVENRQATTALATTDWALIGASGVGTGTGQPFGSWNRGVSEGATWKNISLNSDSFSKIAKGSGNTFFAFVESDDWDNNTPSSENTAGNEFNSADNASNKPTLDVTHAPSLSLHGIERTPIRGVMRGTMRP